MEIKGFSQCIAANKQQAYGLAAAASCGMVAACEFFICKLVLLLLIYMSYLENAILETCIISTFILMSFASTYSVRNILKIGTKYLTGFRRFGCLNSDISKYGNLKEKCLYFQLQI